MAPSRSAMLLMVASTTPLPAGPPSTDGDLRGDIHRRLEREFRKWENILNLNSVLIAARGGARRIRARRRRNPPRTRSSGPSAGPVSYTHLTLPTNREV